VSFRRRREALGGAAVRIQYRVVKPRSQPEPWLRFVEPSVPVVASADMASVVQGPDGPEPLVKLSVYMYPSQRQLLREQAARRGMAMSEYIKFLVDRDRRGFLEEEL
jgi:hypothetical protein